SPLPFAADRADWRLFRADRARLRTPGGRRFDPRPLPDEGEIADRVSRGIDRDTWRYRSRIVVADSAEHVRRRLPVAVDVEPLGPDRSAFDAGSDDPAS